MRLLEVRLLIAGFQCHAIQNRSKQKIKIVKRLSPESGNRNKVDI